MKIFLKLLVFSTMLCAVCYAQNKKAPISGYATIKVDAINFNPKDTLMLMYFTSHYSNEPKQDGDYKVIKKVRDFNGQYTFSFPVTKTSGYYFIARLIREDEPLHQKLPSMKLIHITKLLPSAIGDNIQVSVIQVETPNGGFDYDLYYTGKGADKCTMREATSRMSFNLNGNKTEVLDSNYVYQPNNLLEQQFKEQAAFLKTKEKVLSRVDYNLIVAEVMYRNYTSLNYPTEQLTTAMASPIVSRKRYVEQHGKDILTRLYAKNEFKKIDDETKFRSYNYPYYVLSKIGIPGGLIFGIDSKGAYDYLKKTYSGELRDKLIYYYFTTSDRIKPDMSLLDDALKTIQTPYYREKLLPLKNTNYQFELADTNGKIVKQADLKGKVLVMDFWFTGCGACSGFYESVLSHLEPLFASNDSVKFISISIDRDKESWKRSISSDKYTSTAATNLYTNGQGGNHPVIKFNNVNGYPTIIIQDRNGNRKSYSKEDLWDQKYFKQLLDDLIK